MATTLYLARFGQIFSNVIRPPLGHQNQSTTLVSGYEQSTNVTPMTPTVVSDSVNGYSISPQNGPVTSPGISFGSTIYSNAWVSYPIASSVTISGSLAVDIWAYETSMSANAAIGYVLWVIRPNGTSSVISSSNAASELGTTTAQVTMTVTPTSTTVNPGDMLYFATYWDDAGTMSSVGALVMDSGGAEGATGDSQIRFTENLTFTNTAPAGTTTYFATDASDVAGAGKKKISSATPSSSASYVVDTANAPSQTQWTDTAGGQTLEWYTPQLQAATLNGPITFSVDGASNNAASNIDAEIKIYKTDSSGANPTQVGWARTRTLGWWATAELNEAYGVVNASIGSNERLKVTIHTSSCIEGSSVAGYTGTVRVGSNALGDYTKIIWPGTLTASSSGATLSMNNGAQANTSSLTAITQRHTLSPSSRAQANASSAVVQINRLLVVSSRTQTNSSTSPAIFKSIPAANGVQGLASTQPAVTQRHTLAVASSFQGHTSSASITSNGVVISPANRAQANTSNLAAIIQKHILSVQARLQGNTSTSPLVSSSKSAAANNSVQAHTSGSFTITQKHILSVSAGVQANTPTSLIALSTPVMLSVAGGFQANVSSIFAVVRSYTLSVNSAAQGLASSSLKLGLVINDALQRIWGEKATLIQRQILVVHNRAQAVSSRSIDGPIIRIYQGKVALADYTSQRVSSNLTNVFSMITLSNVNSAGNAVKSNPMIIGDVTYDKLAQAYPTLDSYSATGLKIWQIEQKSTIGHPQSVLDLYNTNYVAKAVLDDGAVFYDPMINGDVSNYISESYSYLSPYEYTRWNKGLSGLNRTGINGYTPYEREYPTYSNRTDLSALNPEDGITMEFFIRPKESFGDTYWGSVYNYTHYIWDEPRQYVNEQIGLRPVNTTITNIGISASVMTLKTTERHKMSVGDTVTTSILYTKPQAVTNYARTSGYDVYTIGSHSIQVGDYAQVQNLSPAYNTYGHNLYGGREVAKVSATTISLPPIQEYSTVSFERMTYTWSANTITFQVANWFWTGWTSGAQVWIDFESGGATADGAFTITALGWGQYSIPYAGSGTGGTLTCMTYTANITGGATTGEAARYIPPHELKDIISVPDDYTMTIPCIAETRSTNPWTYGEAGTGSWASSVIQSSDPSKNPNPQYATMLIHNNMPETWDILGTTNINDGQWHHVAITHESPSKYPDHPEWASKRAVISMWVDGEMQGRLAGDWDNIPLRGLRFPYGSYGYTLGSGTRAWGNSAVAHLAWYGRALREKEIRHHASFISVPPAFAGGYMGFDGVSQWIGGLV